MKTFLIMSLIFASFSFNLACSSLGGGEVTDEQINAEAAKAYAEVKAKSKISRNHEWTQMVNRVAQRIAQASGENFQWEVVLIESPELNAWCMPGGKMAVYTGIMPVLKTEAALAAVMGHEVAHATRRHGKKAYARAIEQNITGALIGGATIIGGELLCKTENCKKITALSGAAAGIALTFFNLKYSRDDESEADTFGQVYMAKAGYEPSESIKLWERMGAASGGKAPPEFMSTHPSGERRQSQLRAWLPEANAIYQNANAKYGLGEAIR